MKQLAALFVLAATFAVPAALAQRPDAVRDAVTSRKLVSSESRRSLPGAPDGEYVVIQYDTQFAHKAHAVETLVPMRERDGSWKASGYFVK